MWWRDAVIYQVYVRSFADSNGDGIGDLPGLISRLDHLSWLGVDALWLSPVHPSPNVDWGYDVADYTAIHPDYGTLDDFDRLVAEAGERGIRILLDLVPNHTSDQHAWFRDPRRRDYYVWADPKPDGSPPNNWVSNFLGPAWTLDERTGRYYLHNFLPEQPDLNWWSPEVADAFDEIHRFWFDRGVAGWRIDVCHAIVKDRELRDNPPSSDEDHFSDRLRGQRQVYNANRPEVHDVLRRWRRTADAYDPPRLLLGETYFFDLGLLPGFYGADDELQLAFNIPFVHSRLEADAMSAIVDAIEEGFPPHAWPCWTGSNHDAGRFASRWADGDERKARCALVLLLTLRGTPVLYYGDEIGMPATPIEGEQLRDPVGVRFWPAYPGRDPGRTPMHWTGEPAAGFTDADVTPWLPFGDAASCNVADQRDDPSSTLRLCRDLLALRRGTPDLRTGTYLRLDAPPDVWCYRRGEGATVVLNLGDEVRTVPDLEGTLALCTDRSLEGERSSGVLSLGPWEAAVLRA
jgi:alpha-glucosidase